MISLFTILALLLCLQCNASTCLGPQNLSNLKVTLPSSSKCASLSAKITATFSLIQSQTISSYIVTAQPSFPSPYTTASLNWTIYGSNSSKSQGTLITINTDTFSPNEVKTYTISNPKSYKYYTIVISNANPKSGLCPSAFDANGESVYFEELVICTA